MFLNLEDFEEVDDAPSKQEGGCNWIKIVDELLEQRKNILQELDDVWDDISPSARYGCDCGCGGDVAMEYEKSLLEELYDVEAELKLH